MIAEIFCPYSLTCLFSPLNRLPLADFLHLSTVYVHEAPDVPAVSREFICYTKLGLTTSSSFSHLILFLHSSLFLQCCHTYFRSGMFFDFSGRDHMTTPSDSQLDMENSNVSFGANAA